MDYRSIYRYNPKLKERAKQLRNNTTLSEVFLWSELKNGKMNFNDIDIKRNMTGVLSLIEQWIEEHTPDPSQEGNYSPLRLRGDVEN